VLSLECGFESSRTAEPNFPHLHWQNIRHLQGPFQAFVGIVWAFLLKNVVLECIFFYFFILNIQIHNFHLRASSALIKATIVLNLCHLCGKPLNTTNGKLERFWVDLCPPWYFHREFQTHQQTKESVLHSAFLSAYWLAGEEIANRKFMSLLQLQELLGVPEIDSFEHKSQG